MEAPRELSLPGGRRLAYADLGDPKGLPVLYCHGFPSCRIEARFAARAAAGVGLRLIVPDRPGLGRSEPLPGRQLLDWPADAAALADHLGADTFALVGVSGGGPYALACAWELGARVRALALVCPLGPLSEPRATAGMALPTRLILGLARRAPATARALNGLVTAPLMTRFPGAVSALLGASASEPDRRLMADPEIRAWLDENVREALRQGGRRASEDLAVLTADWDIDPAAVEVPTSLWHGAADTVVPPATGAALAERLPGCRHHPMPDEGHFSIAVRHAGRILEELADRAGASLGCRGC
jgi:pimeloyl-ACP methyl ester carboxylesterase